MSKYTVDDSAIKLLKIQLEKQFKNGFNVLLNRVPIFVGHSSH